MTHLRRLVRAPGTYFVTSNTWQRRALFHNQGAAQLFLETLFHYREEGRFLLHEFALMPDHFHLLLTPAPDLALERALQYIKGGSSHAVRKSRGGRFPIWQTGFDDHRIRNAGDYERHREYLLKNPVEARLAQRAEDYVYCSAYSLFRGKLDGWPPESASAAKAAVSGEGVRPG